MKCLLAIGAADPGQVLLATSDETAWLYAEHASELGRCFRLLQPPLQTIRRILDKKLFEEAAKRAGLVTIPSWEPKTQEDVAKLAHDLPYPILIKRRTHVHEIFNHKGVLVSNSEHLASEYSEFVRRHTARVGREEDSMPFLQKFAGDGSNGVCSVSGFVDQTGELFVARSSVKVYQRSYPIGVGVCFESRAIDPALTRAVRALCSELGYFGMFEVEFIKLSDAWAVIDFNPRLFNQVALDIRRGMPLPLFACLEATGEKLALRAAVAAAQADPECGKASFCDSFTFRAILTTRALTRRISRVDAAYWRDWMVGNAGHLVDVAKDPDDPLPGLVHMLSELRLGLRAIPKFLRLTPRVSDGSSSPPMDVLL